MDTCIAIRTMVVTGNKVYIQQQVIADIAESEFEETVNKAGAFSSFKYRLRYTR